MSTEWDLNEIKRTMGQYPHAKMHIGQPNREDRVDSEECPNVEDEG